MAETMLTPAQLDAVERDLDDQFTPAPDTVRRLLADLRAMRESAIEAANERNRYAAGIARISAIADEMKET